MLPPRRRRQVRLLLLLGVGWRFEKIPFRMHRAAQFFAKILDRLLQALFQRYSRLPVDDALGARNVRLASLRIVLDGRHRLDAGIAADQIANDDGKLCGMSYDSMFRECNASESTNLQLPSIVCSTGLPIFTGCE